MLITEILDPKLLILMRESGYVREQVHPDFPELRILNYTEKTQFDGRWNDVTEICRGLIYDFNSGEVVARPFRKFFNYNQPGAPDLSLDAEVVAMDKMDGSLGILYQTPDGQYAIATRGSFTSEQAVHATKVLNEKYGDWLIQNEAALKFVTPLFEIIYPENRIVCDYQNVDDLILLGAEVLTAKNSTWDADTARYFFDWLGPVAEIFDYATFGEAIAAKPRNGAEGLVVFFPKTGQRVKIKQEDYIALHRIITGLNARSVWKQAKDGTELNALIENLPDEFHEWVRDVWKNLFEQVDNYLHNIDKEYSLVISLVEQVMGEGFDKDEHRKPFAHFAKLSPYTGFLFSKLDGKDFKDKVWDLFRPEGDLTPSGRSFSEDNT